MQALFVVFVPILGYVMKRQLNRLDAVEQKTTEELNNIKLEHVMLNKEIINLLNKAMTVRDNKLESAERRLESQIAEVRTRQAVLESQIKDIKDDIHEIRLGISELVKRANNAKRT